MNERHNRILGIALVLLLMCAGGVIAQYSILNYREQGGSRTVIGGSLDVVDGGDLDVESGGSFKIAGTEVLASGTPLLVANGGTGLASGTSGGVLAYTASGTLASSAALDDNGVIIGGGAGAVPESITAGTANQALMGSSGAPSFRALTDADIPDAVTVSGGTIENTVIGASTPAAADFTTVDATGAVTGGSLTDGTATFSSGTLTGAVAGTFSGSVKVESSGYVVDTGVSTTQSEYVQRGTYTLSGGTVEVSIPLNYSTAWTIIAQSRTANAAYVSADTTGATFEMTGTGSDAGVWYAKGY